MTSQEATATEPLDRQHVLLFYKFHPLSKDENVVNVYRIALEKLCQSLHLQGRILVGCNEHQSEGINGNLSGDAEGTKAFTYALTKDIAATKESRHQDAVSLFWQQCDSFYDQAGCDSLVMDPLDFKWSSCTETQLFPDLNIKIVKELIGTGGVLAPIGLDDVHKGYLSPSEWHERISELQTQNSDDTVLIDCRNTKEWQIGRFPGAPDPCTTTFNQFPTWVQQHSQTLANKKVLMYCTGGIRCEKASAYIRKQIPTVQEVRHLKGGIHKYLDQYGGKDECLWKGKNFVFDGRGAQVPAGAQTQQNGSPQFSSTNIVGACLYCNTPHDEFDPSCVCTVCREPTLVCPSCREKLREFHCQNHSHLRNCYFTDLSPFSREDLETQLQELNTIIQDIAVGRKYKQKRKTLTKQCEKIQNHLKSLADSSGNGTQDTVIKCRNCGEIGCMGKCWGFHGLKRKRILGEKQQTTEENGTSPKVGSKNAKQSKLSPSASNNAHLQEKKAVEKQRVLDELKMLMLWSDPSCFRDKATGIRIPKCCTRLLTTNTKGKWCGKSLLSVLQSEYGELSDTSTLIKILQNGLLMVNESPISSIEEAESMKLKNMDVISRIVHWHEPPVLIPQENIQVHHITLPPKVCQEYQLADDGCIYFCNKPSSVPVHPAGPYLSNSLTMMVEAQEGLAPKSLIPCHRIDRVTSGLTICCTDVKVARLIQSHIDEGSIEKLYIAKVHNKFPSDREGAREQCPECTDTASWIWDEVKGMLQVVAPIETVDPANGIRKITKQGKSAESWFHFVDYDHSTNTSMIACSPITGRSHQLRVHLQWLGFPIVHDVQYGGNASSFQNIPTELFQVCDGSGKTTESLHLPSISDENVLAAKSVCQYCNTGPRSAFSPAQLLQGGHEICLHAFRYMIPFHGKGQRKKGFAETLACVEMQVDLPPWAFALEQLMQLRLPALKV